MNKFSKSLSQDEVTQLQHYQATNDNYFYLFSSIYYVDQMIHVVSLIHPMDVEIF